MELTENIEWKERYKKLKFFKMVSLAWNIVLKNWKILLGINLIAIILDWFISSDIFLKFIINTFLLKFSLNLKYLLSFSGFIIFNLINILMVYVYYLAVIRNENNEKIKLIDFKSQKKYLIRILLLQGFFFILMFVFPLIFFIHLRPELSIFNYNTYIEMYKFALALIENYSQFLSIQSVFSILVYIFVFIFGFEIILSFSIIELFEKNKSFFSSIKSAFFIFLKKIFVIFYYHYIILFLCIILGLITFNFSDFLTFPITSIFQIILYKKVIETSDNKNIDSDLKNC
ncbi:MAG: hypothetical protein M0R46_13385 [Candidatus Muirbacterium halophilum]|nr:hypothetical protein [Candidatus Muirbacterium halophilum]MCK9476914.1 hypothetical protein [Candidatus Muirbacterium halophilum]